MSGHHKLSSAHKLLNQLDLHELVVLLEGPLRVWVLQLCERSHHGLRQPRCADSCLCCKLPRAVNVDGDDGQGCSAWLPLALRFQALKCYAQLACWPVSLEVPTADQGYEDSAAASCMLEHIWPVVPGLWATALVQEGIEATQLQLMLKPACLLPAVLAGMIDEDLTALNAVHCGLKMAGLCACSCTPACRSQNTCRWRFHWRQRRSPVWGCDEVAMQAR